MKAIILAGGRGSRLGTLTDDRPKALVEFNGVPLIERSIGNLRAAGITEIGIVAGYRSDMLAAYADRLFINPSWGTSGIYTSLSMANEWLKSQTCIVSYGDIFYPTGLVSALLQLQGDIGLAFDPNAFTLWQQRFDAPLDDLETFIINDGALSSIGHRADTLAQVQGQYMGLFKLTPASWSLLTHRVEKMTAERAEQIDMTSLFSLLLSDGVRIAITPTEGPWGEIDFPEDVRLYERIYPDV